MNQFIFQAVLISKCINSVYFVDATPSSFHADTLELDILNKSENAIPELFTIYIQNDAVSKANENVSECSNTGLCITGKVNGCCHEERHESHLNVTGVQYFKLKIGTGISHSLGLQKSTTYQVRLHEMVVWTGGQPEISRTYHKCVLIG